MRTLTLYAHGSTLVFEGGSLSEIAGEIEQSKTAIQTIADAISTLQSAARSDYSGIGATFGSGNVGNAIGEGAKTGETGETNSATPDKRKRRTKAEMEQDRAAEAAKNADAGEVPPLQNDAATPPPPVNKPAAPPPPPVKSSTPPPPPPPKATTPPPPALLAGLVIAELQDRIGRDGDEAKPGWIEWLFSASIVNSKDVSWDEAIATIRLMKDEQLAQVADMLEIKA